MISELYIRDILFSGDPACDSYLKDLPVVNNLRKMGGLELKKPVTFFVGENGTGKSTLLEAIAVAYGFNPEGGSKNFNFNTFPSHSGLYDHLRLSRGVRRPRDGYFLRAESFYNVATNIEEMDAISSFASPVKGGYGGKSLHEQSHGEGFLSLMLHRFFGNGLYILDEPEAALSPTRLMSLLVRIDELVKCNSQFLIATHSPILTAYPDADIFTITPASIQLTPYKDTENYILTKQFLNNPEGMLRQLLDPPDGGS